jgi:uncharacterized protein DUF4349
MKTPSKRVALLLAIPVIALVVLAAGALPKGRSEFVVQTGVPLAMPGATAAPAAAIGAGEARSGTVPGLTLNGGPGQVAQAAPPVQPKPGQDQPLPIPVPQAFEGDRALILTANVALRAGDPWAIADSVQAIASGLGGDVIALNQSGGKDQKSASLTIRVPQASFNDALRQIRSLSDVEVVSSGVTGQDVTDQYVDLQARLKAKQDEEQRYLALLARADKVEDILRIDTVLAQVRTQIEQLTGQVNSIKARTTYSTIAVQIMPLAPPIPAPGPLAYDPSRTVERAVSALASLMRGALDAAIWTLVFGWIPLVLFGLVLLVTRTRSRMITSA